MKKIIVISAFAFLCVITTGCLKNNQEKPNLPSKDEYFNFNLRESVKLDVNYYVPGLNTVIEVFAQDPTKAGLDTKGEAIKPIYVAYTEDGKYSGNMVIPTNITEAYVCTKSISAPKYVKLIATENGFTYDATKQDMETRNSTTGSFPFLVMGLVDKNKFPYEVATTATDGGKRNDNLYSITAWQPRGWECMNPNYYSKPTTIGYAKEKVGDVIKRMEAYMDAQRDIDGNKSLLRNPDQINIKVPSTATDGMSVNVTYAGEKASFFNTFGYYYYEDKGTTLTPEEFYKIRKYIIIPNVDDNNMTAGETVKLLYFDNNGVQSDKFPANYVIGWFIISNGFGNNPDGANVGGYPNGGVIKTIPANAYTSPGSYSQERNTCMSDDTGNDRRFVSLYDTKSKLRIFGIEDGVRSATDDFMDVMFIIQTSIDLGGGSLPPIGPEDPASKPTVWSVSGTVAFEDIWPNGGDYDLNDVIVEYNRDITFGKDNIVTNIKDSFKPVQKKGSAGQDNFFACNYTNMGTVTPQQGVIIEQISNSVVIEASAKTISGNTYVIERDMSGINIKQEEAQTDFNPYIITRSYKPQNRIEVHLPMHEMTNAADKSLMTLDNAYFISKDKIYPFAIDIPIANFIPADDLQRIDSPGQYPSFKKWAESKGKECEDWYLRDKGKQ